MHALTAAEVVRVWESGQRLLPVDRGVAILGAALPERAPESLESLLLGEQQALLFRLRALTFGPELDGVVDCPECEETLEFTLDVGAIALDPPLAGEGEVALKADDLELRIRPLNVADLRAAARCGDLAVARRLLGERVVVRAIRDGVEVPPGELSEVVISMIAAELADLDAGAESLLALTCPACGAAVSPPLDASELVWSEIGSLAGRLLEEVHTLASAYGWTEREVLALSPARRSAYIELVTG